MKAPGSVFVVSPSAKPAEVVPFSPMPGRLVGRYSSGSTLRAVAWFWA